MRDEGTVRNKAVYVALGVRPDDEKRESGGEVRERERVVEGLLFDQHILEVRLLEGGSPEPGWPWLLGFQLLPRLKNIAAQRRGA